MAISIIREISGFKICTIYSLAPLRGKGWGKGLHHAGGDPDGGRDGGQD